MTVRVTPWEPGATGQKRWMVDVRARRADGSKVRDRKVVEGTQSAARGWGERRHAVLLGELHAPGPVTENHDDTSRRVLTVRQWAKTFTGRYYQGCKQSAADTAMGIVHTSIVQLVGDVRLDQFDQSVMDNLEARWRAGGYPELKRDRLIRPTSSRKTLNNRKMVLISLLKYAVECSAESGLTAMPCKITLSKVDTQRAPRHYELETYAKLIKVASKNRRALAIVLLGGDCGLRLSEMIALKWADVNFRTGAITVRTSVYQRTVAERFEDSTKGGLEKGVPMTPRLAAALKRLDRNGENVLHRDGRALTMKGIAWIMKMVERAVGLPEMGAVHVLRHTFCTHLAMAGVPARDIMDLARHADLSTTLKYMHVAKNSATDAMKKLARLHAT